MSVPTVGVTTDAVESSYWVTRKGVYYLTKPSEFSTQQVNSFAGKINLNLAIAPVTSYGAVASEPSSQNNFNIQDFNTGETWQKSTPTFSGGVMVSQIETITKHNVNRILLISPDKKYLMSGSKPLYIQDQASANGIGYLFANTKLFHPDRNDDDCLAFAAVAYYRPDPINRPWAGNPFYYATRKGATYGDYWGVIDLCHAAGIKDASGMVEQFRKWADETNHEMAQHWIDMAHYRQNVILFAGLGLMAAMGITAAIFAPAVTAAPVATSAPVTVSFLEPETTAGVVSATAPTSLLTKAISAGGDALNAAIPAAIGKLTGQLQDAIAPKIETAKPVANTNTQTPNSGTGLIAILGAIGVALLFFI